MFTGFGSVTDVRPYAVYLFIRPTDRYPSAEEHRREALGEDRVVGGPHCLPALCYLRCLLERLLPTLPEDRLAGMLSKSQILAHNGVDGSKTSTIL